MQNVSHLQYLIFCEIKGGKRDTVDMNNKDVFERYFNTASMRFISVFDDFSHSVSRISISRWYKRNRWFDRIQMRI